MLEERREPPDVVILDADLEDDNPCEMVRSIRHGKLGSNPFLTVVMTTSIASNDRVRAIVESGADGLLLKPISPAAVMERLAGLVRQRKPFIVTSAYIGPDRRKDPARGPSSIPLFDVPNTLRAKAEGRQPRLGDLEETIARAQKAIDEEKRRRDAFQITFLAGLIVSGTPGLNDDDANRDYLDSLIDACSDLLERISGHALRQAGRDLHRTAQSGAADGRDRPGERTAGAEDAPADVGCPDGRPQPRHRYVGAGGTGQRGDPGLPGADAGRVRCRAAS